MSARGAESGSITMSSGAYVALMANDGMLDRDADIINREICVMFARYLEHFD